MWGMCFLVAVEDGAEMMSGEPTCARYLRFTWALMRLCIGWLRAVRDLVFADVYAIDAGMRQLQLDYRRFHETSYSP